MSRDDVPPIPPLERDALLALAAARSLVGPEEDVRRRMRARLASAMVAPSGGGTEGAPAGPGAGAVAGTKVSLWVVALALAAGVGIGWLARRPPEAVVPTAPTPSEPPTTRPSAQLATPPLATVRLHDLPTVPNAATSARPAPPDLAAERALLDVARTALGRGAGGNALTACSDHARKYPRGSLSEEREAIAVQALVLEGRDEDARARAERFRRTYPRSIFLPAVLAAAGVEP